MAIIKSGNSTDQLSVDPISKAARVTQYDTSGNIVTPPTDHTTAANPSSTRLSDGTNFYKGTTPTDTQPISAASLPLPSGAATSALQTQPGVDIGDVTVNNASGVSAVNIQDGGNSITIDGAVSISGSVAVTGPLTDTQLRASAVPTSSASLPLPSGASTEATLALIKAKTDNLDVALSTRTKPADTQAISGSVSVSNFPATQPISGTITAKAVDAQTLLGVYYYHGGANTVQAAADAATAGRFWIINPVGSGVTLRIKSIEFASQLGSALIAPTSPRITVERVTFTGTASGATLAPAKRKTTDASPVGSLRTASTGLSLTAGNTIISFLPVASATAVGYTTTAVEKWKPDVDDRIDLVAGEGIVIRQPDAGTTADTRRFTVDLTVEEF